MILIGLTGGIGSGKSTVSALLAARGAVIIDADAIARELQAPGAPLLFLLAEKFAHGFKIHGPLLRGLDWFNRAKGAVSSGVFGGISGILTLPIIFKSTGRSGQGYVFRIA